MELRFEFIQELRGLPSDVAAELEDHLATVAEAAVASGATHSEARAKALALLGDPQSVGREMVQARNDLIWGRRRAPLPLKAVAAIWIGFGLVCLSRICTDADPSYERVAVCLVTGLASSCLALGLLRMQEGVRRLMVGFLLVLGAGAVMAAIMPSGGLAGVPVATAWLPWMASASMISAWILSRPYLRGNFT